MQRISRAGRYWYYVHNLAPDAGAVVRLWVALPFTRPGQEVALGALTPEPARIVMDPLGGNRIACWEVADPPADGPLVFTVDFEVVAETVRTAVDPAAVEPYDREGPEYERYTRDEPWIELTPEIRAVAREVAGDETNPHLAARRVFDWVVRELAYEYPDIADRGAAKSFVRRKGDCGEFSIVFVAMCRALGIPARAVVCNWFTGYGHVWAEFLCPPYGWIPVDASVAEGMRSGGSSVGEESSSRKFCENRGIPPDDPDWLFGNLYANRLIVFVGTNVEAAGRTFSFMQPGGEASHPEGFEAVGCGDHVVHGGFYLFDEGRDDPERAREHAKRKLAKAYFDAGLPDESEEGFRLLVAESPEDSLAWFHLGQIHMERGEIPAARAALTSCVEGDMGSVQPVLTALARMMIGNGYDLEGRREEAVAEYEAIVASGVDFQGVGDQARAYLETPFTGESPD